jgi:CHAT domain-containing protein
MEAEAIIATDPQGSSFKAVDWQASRATAMSPELGQYRIVHFATHGLLNSDHPELSGIILSMLDEEGRPQNGFLRLHDIYNLELPADLVVLSACNSALGKQVRGEGLIGKGSFAQLPGRDILGRGRLLLACRGSLLSAIVRLPWDRGRFRGPCGCLPALVRSLL